MGFRGVEGKKGGGGGPVFWGDVFKKKRGEGGGGGGGGHCCYASEPGTEVVTEPNWFLYKKGWAGESSAGKETGEGHFMCATQDRRDLKSKWKCQPMRSGSSFFLRAEDSKGETVNDRYWHVMLLLLLEKRWPTHISHHTRCFFRSGIGARYLKSHPGAAVCQRCLVWCNGGPLLQGGKKKVCVPINQTNKMLAVSP